MKKIIIMVFIILSGITSSYAVFFIDGQYSQAATGDYEYVSGGAFGLGFSLTDDINFLVKASIETNTENKGALDELKYELARATGGIEYIPSFDILDEYRVYWRTSLNLGAAEFESDMPEIKDSDETDIGVHLSFWTGLQFNFTQNIAPFFDIGYHKTFFTLGDSDLAISGWQMAFGVRFYIGGSRDYNTGF